MNKLQLKINNISLLEKDEPVNNVQSLFRWLKRPKKKVPIKNNINLNI